MIVLLPELPSLPRMQASGTFCPPASVAAPKLEITSHLNCDFGSL